MSSSVFRSHEGNIPSVSAQFYNNASTYKYYAYNARMFIALSPYRRKVLDTECTPKGWPLLRFPAMVHPNDMKARQISYESLDREEVRSRAECHSSGAIRQTGCLRYRGCRNAGAGLFLEVRQERERYEDYGGVKTILCCQI